MATSNKDFKVKNGLQVGGDGSFSGTVSVAYPTDPTHAATKQYVDENAGGGSGQFPDISDTFPVDPVNGQLWLDSITGRLYIYYVDSTSPASSQWIELTYGSTGPSGLQGETGPAGPANTLTIGSVSSGPAAASITGTAPNQVLNLVIPTGSTGATGPANTLSIGTVTTGTAGSNASASITGTAPNQVLNLVLPRGATGNTGPANTLSIGTVTTGEAGTEAQAIISGTAPNQTLNFIIPRGAQGLQGLQGIPGPVGDLPDKTGNGGKLLTTDGSTASWSDTLAGPLLAQSFRPTSSTAPTNGMYLSGTNEVGISTSGNRRFRIDSNGLASFDRSLHVGRGIDATTAFLEIGNGRTADGISYIDLTGDTTYTDFGTRLMRNSGANATTDFLHRGTGNLNIAASDAGTITLGTNGSPRITVGSSGQLTFSGVVQPATVATAATGVGYTGIPQSSAATTGAYTLAIGDAGDHIYTTATRTVTIPGNTTGTGPVAFPIGSTIIFINDAGATLTLQMQATTTDTCVLAGTGTSMTGGSGTRTLAPHGMATLVKVTATRWYISGNGLT